MIIKEIELNNYRNYEKLKLKFNKNINIIIGDNAQGKTNILEAIYFLSVTKSYRTNYEENLIKHKKTGSVQRVNAPIFRRLKVMDKEMLEEFVCSDIETSKYILLYAIMKTDRLVRDFVIEVYKDKLYMRKEYIEKFDIDNWYEEKCILSETLRERTESTSAKLKQVIMKILQDSGLVIKEKDRFKIVRPLLKEKYISMLDKNGDMEYAKAIGGLV